MHLQGTFIQTLFVVGHVAATVDQKPLGQGFQDQAQGWLSAAKAYIPTALPTVPGLTVPAMPAQATRAPVSAAAAKLAGLKMHSITNQNWDSVITPPKNANGPPSEWMIFVSGGNKTCGGYCHNLEVAWNETVTVLSADPTSPKLGLINCDLDPVLCAFWSAKPPTIWHIQRRDSAAGLKTDIHINYMNVTTATSGEMLALHTAEKYKTGILHDGILHPFDGQLAQFGVLRPAGYIFYYLGLIPSWTMMLAISMGSRTFLSRRTRRTMEREQSAARGPAPAAT